MRPTRMRLLQCCLAVLLPAAATCPGYLAAQIVVDGRVVETKADGVCIGFLTLATSQRYVDCLNGTVYDTSTGTAATAR